MQYQRKNLEPVFPLESLRRPRQEYQASSYFGCGRYYIKSWRQGGIMAGDYIVTKFKDINEKIIPFLNRYLQGTKALDFSDFKRVAYSCSEHQKFSLLQSSALMENKAHLTSAFAELRTGACCSAAAKREGLEHIRLIKSGMNRGRVNSELGGFRISAFGVFASGLCCFLLKQKTTKDRPKTKKTSLSPLFLVFPLVFRSFWFFFGAAGAAADALKTKRKTKDQRQKRTYVEKMSSSYGVQSA
jgi:hypothetical protein